MLESGCVHVYTGDGKGKTTASIGQAMRAIGQGLRVCLIQFMKADGDKSGEIKVLEKLTGREVLRFGRGLINQDPGPEDYEEARLGLAEARRVMASCRCDLLVLDEINVALDYGFVELEDVLDLIASKPANTELLLTGRRAHPAVIEAADYVTEMTLHKHPFDKFAAARRGIEY